MNKLMITLNEEEARLLLSALENDRVGNWGDGREEKINSLMNKIKSTKPLTKITGFTKE